VTLDMELGEVVGEPTVQARAFHGPNGVLDFARDLLVEALRGLSKEELKDVNRVRRDSMDVVRRAIQKRASRRPMVVPTVVEV
jgi:mRNA degradation ribonuclease J1/J2